MAATDPPQALTRLGRMLAYRSVGMFLVAATCALSFWFNLDGTTLWDPDEGRHASIAREMLARGEWLTPTLNGQPYHDKPVLFYWLVALSLHAFGHEAWAVRIPSALAATAVVLATAVWGMRFIAPLTGTLAGLVLATAGLWVGLGRLGLLDMLFSAWLSLALLYGIAWLLAGGQRGLSPWPVYVAVALATLTKGPAALVLAAVILAFVTYQTGAPWGAWRPLQGALIIAAIVGAWLIPAAILAPHYVYDFVWRHNVERFTHATVGHSLNVLAYFYWLPATFLPWSLYWPGALHRLWQRGLRHLSPAIEACVIWVIVIFVFFTVSAAKLATYMLPVFPPLALLTAAALTEAFRVEPLGRVQGNGYRFAFHALELLAIGLAVTAVIMGKLFWPYAVLSGLTPIALCLPLPLALGHYCLRTGQLRLLVPTTYAVMVLLLVGFYGFFAPWLNDVFSLATPARLTRLLPEDRQVFTADSPAGSLSFYTEMPIQRLATIADAATHLAKTDPVAIVTKTKRLPELAGLMNGPAYVWWESRRIKVLVVNRPPPEGSGISVRSLHDRIAQ